MIRQAIETSGPLIDAQQHKLTIDIPAREIVLDADVVRLTQVFANLLNNAAKYTPRGGSIAIKAEQRGDAVIVRVIDNGIGIPQEMLPRVFDMFMQVDKSLGARPRRTGHRAVAGQALGRDAWRAPSRRTARVPAWAASSSCACRPPGLRPPTSDAGLGDERRRRTGSLGHRILIVDDNVDAATSLAVLLGLMGHETRTAHDGLEAMAVADQFKPDVALLDIGMPKLNGYETARRMRQETWGRQMLLVALTGWGQETDRARSDDAGFDSHLVKPVDIAEIERLLARQAPAPEYRAGAIDAADGIGIVGQLGALTSGAPN